MGPESQSTGVDAGELRQRLPRNPEKPQQATSVEEAQRTVMELNAAEGRANKDEKDKKTFGRTPDGTIFTVPETHDMVSQLFDPREPKNISDAIVIVILGSLIALLWLLPRSVAIPTFAVIFLFWRACYNAGIGWLLNEQSHHKAMVGWAKKYKVFENPAKGNQPRPALYKILKREMETKIPKDYKFEEAPLEYNTWLLFRRVVDLILMCDFVSYCLFAAACGGTPPGENFLLTIARWVIGWALIFFNLWVKLDAHRVVKDFAWYWGDFFFLIDQELTFDGVFEMAPHPMYSVGYVGFYGISLMAASYKVLFISIIAHAAQFAFLVAVESPHIEKTYNPAPSRKQMNEAMQPELEKLEKIETNFSSYSASEHATVTATGDSVPRPSFVRDLIGLQNIDMHLVTDTSTILLQFYLFTMAVLTPSTPFFQAFFVVNAVIWRLWYSLGIGYILDRQSKKKKWVRHFIKYGQTAERAWRQWKGIYHLSMTMCYASLGAAAYKLYHLPADWQYGAVTLRHVLGLALIALQLWTVFSIYDSLGEFGWFFGDFFYDKTPELTYGGIYRFLNQPERIIGLAGVWGLALITWSRSMFFLAVLSHGLTLVFLTFVERPHMQRRYGRALREHSGVTKNIQRSIPPTIRAWQDSVEKSLDEYLDRFEEWFERATPQWAANVENMYKDAKTAFMQYPGRLSAISSSTDLQSLDRKDYSISIEGTSSISRDKNSKREGDLARSENFRGKEFKPKVFEYGCAIRVKWTAPLSHDKRDWVGLYMIADNGTRDVTRISSQGRWIACTKGHFENFVADEGILVSDKQVIEWENDTGKPIMTGEMEFSGDKLWWTTGAFEFRYHHAGKHNVMAISQPFEIRITRFGDDDLTGVDVYSTTTTPPRRTSTTNSSGSPTPMSPTTSSRINLVREAVEQTLLPLVRNCFDRDPDIAPDTIDDSFGGLVERDGKFAQRVVFALLHIFGIEFAPEVVKADGNVRNLAWRVVSARGVLAPYSLQLAAVRGSTTPPTLKE